MTDTKFEFDLLHKRVDLLIDTIGDMVKVVVWQALAITALVVFNILALL